MMATILLAAAGASIGSSLGGTVLGLSGAVLGRAAGAVIGKSIDQRLLGTGSDAVESGSVDRFHVSGAGYGTPVKEVWGRMRIAGEVIWASRFMQSTSGASSGKGSTGTNSGRTTFTVSIAIALCRGEIQSIGRIWADGVEIARNSIEMRVYTGSSEQLPDPKIEAVEGTGMAPSYRGIAYLIIEDLSISRFGNRVPQFSCEVIREAQSTAARSDNGGVRNVRGVALIPGSGEYALATTPVHFDYGLGVRKSANVHTIQRDTDFTISLNQLNSDLPICGSVSLVVSWFGSDLRCAHCSIRPKIEQNELDPVEMPWVVSGQTRSTAQLVAKLDGKPIYGGTPADQSVIEAISALKESGKEVMFYPFILMDQQSGNILPDPWTSELSQPALPWRGRITTTKAPGMNGTTDRSAAAESEISQFLGNAVVEDFLIDGNSVNFSGAPEFGYRRFVLHYAHLCKLAGGVEAFCVGSELKGLTQIRSLENTFPMVAALKQLAAEVKHILGTSTKVSYAADWSEYFGLHSGGDIFFNLDEFWSDPNVDFVGIDNYMPITDWRDGRDHLDAEWKSIYNLNYLMSGISGGEGYDWYYRTPEAAATQQRTPITDEVYGEHWVFRYKDLHGWWSSDHHSRVGGERQNFSSNWVPGMKPIRFTEYGCAAIDKGTNEPNKFLDTKSSESGLPRQSNGSRDDYLQGLYIHCVLNFWKSKKNNPPAEFYSGCMVDLDHCYLWAWDSRPYPDFPGNSELWSDFENYDKGHWLNGRSSNQSVASITLDICVASGLSEYADVSELFGSSMGFTSLDTQLARSKLQALTMAYGFDVFQDEGQIRFVTRKKEPALVLDVSKLAVISGARSSIKRIRSSISDSVGRVRLGFVETGNDFSIRSVEAVGCSSQALSTSDVDLNVQLTDAAARSVVERWMNEIVLSRDRVFVWAPKSLMFLSAGSVISIGTLNFRVERIEDAEILTLEAVQIDDSSYKTGSEVTRSFARTAPNISTEVFAHFLDLPLISNEEIPYAPRIAVSVSPWSGSVSVWAANSGSFVTTNTLIEFPSVVGKTEGVLLSSISGLWDKGSRLRVRIAGGQLSSVTEVDALNGANLAAIGDGTSDNWELIQFATANLIDVDTYELTCLLRGQSGTDLVERSSWPIGSHFVLINYSTPQITLPESFRGLERTYYIGHTDDGYLGRNVVVKTDTFMGIGLRPYTVAHLRAVRLASMDVSVTWIRRTRVGGDSWISVEVPLGEEREEYTVRVIFGSSMMREVLVNSPFWMYTTQIQQLDGVSGTFQVSVAQNSQSFGVGPFVEVAVS